MNLTSYMAASKDALPHMIARGSGAIILILTAAAEKTVPELLQMIRPHVADLRKFMHGASK